MIVTKCKPIAPKARQKVARGGAFRGCLWYLAVWNRALKGRWDGMLQGSLSWAQSFIAHRRRANEILT